MQGEEADAGLVHLDVVGVDLLVPVDHLLGEGVVPFEQGAHHAADLVLDQPTHGEQRLLESLQLFVKVPLHGGLRARV